MKSFLKFLSRNKLYTAVEAAGLIVSIAFVILIGNYIWQQYSSAYENPIGNRIYGIGKADFLGLSWWDKYELEQKIPEAEAVCRIGGNGEVTVTIGENKVLSQASYLDANFTELFPYLELTEGNIAEFAMQGRCLVSQSFANTHFDGDAVGRQMQIVIYMETPQELTVCGVYPDLDNTMMQPSDILLNAEYDPLQMRSRPFGSIGSYLTLIKVREGVERDVIARKVHETCRPNYNEEWIPEFKIYSLPEIYFHSEQWYFRRGDKQMLGMLTVVVLLLLVSAIFNYENLNLALSGRRAKEMATRRLLGASKLSVAGRFIAESVAFTAVCFALATVLAYALLPMVDNLVAGASIEDIYTASLYLHMRIRWSAGIVAVCIVMILLLGFVAGIAPAIFASRFKPIDIVRGTFRRRTKMTFSKLFIIFQNTVSVVLVALALVMEVQMHHMMTRPLNARSEGVFCIQFLSNTYEDVAPLVDRLQRIPGVGRIGYGTGYAGRINMVTYLATPNGIPSATFSLLLADEDYFDIMGLHILERRDAPASNTMWMSESMAREVGLTDSLEMFYGRQVQFNGIQGEYFGGIYADIPTRSASAADIMTNSAIVVSRREEIKFGQGLIMEVTGNRKETVDAIKKAYAEYNKEHNGVYVPPFRMGFIDDILSDSLTRVRAAMRLLEMFMLLSVVISLLGLVAMSTYFSGENTKSIAIRKVFGSNVSRELWRTVSGYMLLVAAAVAIGIPTAVWLAEKYLQQFAYRIENYRWIFVVAAAVSVTAAFLSVLWQVLSAARTNPAKELKKE